MRINVYGEELTTETELVTKTVHDDRFGQRRFYGLRFYLQSPDSLHHSPQDDDRSAITLWVPWSTAVGSKTEILHILLDSLQSRLAEVDRTQRADTSS